MISVQLGDFEYHLLAKLREMGPSNPTDLLKALEKEWPVAYTTLTTTLYRLERKGLLASRRVGVRRRVFYVDEEGEAYRQQARSLWERLLTTFGPASVTHLIEDNSKLGEAEIEALLAEINRLREGDH